VNSSKQSLLARQIQLKERKKEIKKLKERKKANTTTNMR